MSGLPMVTVVAVQVIVFQMLSRRLTRVLPDVLVGVRDLPAATEAELERFRARAGGGRVVAGAVLLGILAAAVAVGTSTTAAKLMVTAVSLTSSLLLVGGCIRDRVVVGRLAAAVPAPAVRSAAVSRPRLRDLYSPLWEVVVIGVWIAAAVPAVRGILAGVPASGLLLTIVLLQAVVALGGLVFVVWYVASGARLPQRARVRFGAAAGSGVDHALRQAEFRAFLAARSGILVLLGVQAASRTPVADDYARFLDGASWAMVGALIVVFGVYLVATARITARARAESRC